MFNIWVIEQNGDCTLVRENVSEALAHQLVEMGNHGAKILGREHHYEMVAA